MYILYYAASDKLFMYIFNLEFVFLPPHSRNMQIRGVHGNQSRRGPNLLEHFLVILSNIIRVNKNIRKKKQQEKNRKK